MEVPNSHPCWLYCELVGYWESSKVQNEPYHNSSLLPCSDVKQRFCSWTFVKPKQYNAQNGKIHSSNKTNYLNTGVLQVKCRTMINVYCSLTPRKSEQDCKFSLIPLCYIRLVWSKSVRIFLLFNSRNSILFIQTMLLKVVFLASTVSSSYKPNIFRCCINRKPLEKNKPNWANKKDKPSCLNTE